MIYEINIMGSKCILSLGEPTVDTLSPDIVLLPSFTCDYTVEDRGGTHLSDEELSLFLTWLFGSLFAYPECEMEILRGGRRKTVPILSGDIGRVKRKAYKCKELYTKSVEMPDGVELTVTAVEGGGSRILVTLCESPQLFDVLRLSILRVAPTLPLSDAVFAVSIAEGEAEVMSSTDAPLRSRLLLLSYLARRGLSSASFRELGAVKLSLDFIFLPVVFYRLS